MSTPPQRNDVSQYLADAMQQHDSIGLGNNQEHSGVVDEESRGSSVISSEDRRPPRVSNDGIMNELARARVRIRELTQAASGRRSDSKNKTRRCLKNLPSADRCNVHTVYCYIDDKLWSQHHIRLTKWPRYSGKNKTMCQRILRCGIKIPAGTSEIEHWQSVLVMAVNNKYTFNKSNVFEKTKVQHRGK